MKKKILLFLLVCGLVIGLGNVPNVHAYPVFNPGENNLFIHNAENWVDVDSNQEISDGDYFYGILQVQEIKLDGLTQWNQNNLTPGLDTFTGYFLTEVTSTSIVPGSDYQINLGVYEGTSDPMGVLTDAEIAAGVVMKMWTDTSTVWEENGTVAQDIANSTDGTAWASFSLDGGYWYTLAPIVVPIEGSVGQSYLGLNVVTDYTGVFQYGLGQDVNDPNEYQYNFDVDLYANSELEVNGTTTSPYWQFLSNDPAVFHVPEPATMLLLGSGLLGLAVLGRKKKFFKKD